MCAQQVFRGLKPPPLSEHFKCLCAFKVISITIPIIMSTTIMTTRWLPACLMSRHEMSCFSSVIKFGAKVLDKVSHGFVVFYVLPLSQQLKPLSFAC